MRNKRILVVDFVIQAGLEEEYLVVVVLFQAPVLDLSSAELLPGLGWHMNSRRIKALLARLLFVNIHDASIRSPVSARVSTNLVTILTSLLGLDLPRLRLLFDSVLHVSLNLLSVRRLLVLISLFGRLGLLFRLP